MLREELRRRSHAELLKRVFAVRLDRARLAARAAAAIRGDLAARPDALLADTLRAILDAGSWVEQECWLGR